MTNRLKSLLKWKKLPYAILVILVINIFGSVYLWGLLQKEDSGLNMNHKTHVSENELECTNCHSINEKNTRLVTFNGHDACIECHDDSVKSSDKKECLLCHKNTDNKTNLRKDKQLFQMLNFDHKDHVESDVKCLDCHKKASEIEEVSGNNMLPEMETCVACHEEQSISKPDDCNTCHLKGFENVRPTDHTPFWLSSHGKILDEDTIEKSCNTCHTKKKGNDCLSCHRREKPKDHTISFRIRGHAQQAMISREKCVTCHTQPECTSCHITNPPFSHTGFWGAPNNRHCVNCHTATPGDFSGAGITGNCSFCHTSSRVNAQHTSIPKPGFHVGASYATCSIGCHSNLKHPYPTDLTRCENCHQ